MDQVTQDVRAALEKAEKILERGDRAKIVINRETGVVHLFEYERGLVITKTLFYEGRSFMGIVHI